MKIDGRQSFSFREGERSHCLRLRPRRDRLAAAVERRPGAQRLKGPVRPLVTVSRVLQAVSRNRQVTRTSIRRMSGLPLISRTSGPSDLPPRTKLLSRTEKAVDGDGYSAGLWPVNTLP